MKLGITGYGNSLGGLVKRLSILARMDDDKEYGNGIAAINKRLDKLIEGMYDVGEYQIDLLWTNPNPSQAIQTLNIELDLSEYDFVLLNTRWGDAIMPIEATNRWSRISEVHPESNNIIFTYRSIQAFPTYVNIGACHEGVLNPTNNSYNYTDRPDTFIPEHIFGIRKTFK